jgi:bifunctional DNase/RNase
MRLRRIVLCENQDAHSISLMEVDGTRHFSMVVGLFEARSIDHRVRKIQTPRPLTHDLIGGVIDILGGEIQDVIIHELREGTYFARIRIRREGEMFEVDARPSDAIALAVTLDVPIYVEESVIEEANSL